MAMRAAFADTDKAADKILRLCEKNCRLQQQLMTAEREAAACTEKELANLGPVSAPPEEKEDDEEQQQHLYEIREQKNKRTKEQNEQQPGTTR